MTESKWGKNIRGYSSFGNHLRFGHSASEQLAGAEWIFQTQDVCDLMAERGVAVVHTTVLRWVQCFVGSQASHQAVAKLKAEGVLPAQTLVRTNKYLNNLIEQDHRKVK
jgi:transposase-like protein